MNPTTVLYVLDLLATVGVRACLDGGWGVDALLGRISRVHDDLDLVVALDDLTRAVEVLVRNGFAIEEEELGRVVLGHADHGRIDRHPVTFDAHGNGVQVQPAEVPLVYPKEAPLRAASLVARLSVFRRMCRSSFVWGMTVPRNTARISSCCAQSLVSRFPMAGTMCESATPAQIRTPSSASL